MQTTCRPTVRVQELASHLSFLQQLLNSEAPLPAPGFPDNRLSGPFPSVLLAAALCPLLTLIFGCRASGSQHGVPTPAAASPGNVWRMQFLRPPAKSQGIGDSGDGTWHSVCTSPPGSEAWAGWRSTRSSQHRWLPVLDLVSELGCI